MPTTVELEVASRRDALPLSHRSTNDRIFALVAERLLPGQQMLDLGAGTGYFSRRVGAWVREAHGATPRDVITACDVTPEIFEVPEIVCDRILGDGTLPYSDASFDLVCSIEVIEHVQDQFKFCREVMRVLRPGGLAILSTPNVLNMNSRWRTLHSGFATLFEPLSLSSVDVVHTSGHIHPVNYYYLAYALRHAGAAEVGVSFDRVKRSAVLLWLLSLPVLLLGQWAFRLAQRRKRPGVWIENSKYIKELHSAGMATSRSVIVRATRGATQGATRREHPERFDG